MSDHIALAVPLAGRQLLEAGAGTGKTFAIKTIFLRLILEARLRIEAILTVTYTEAAAAELTDRIRSTLEEALRALEEGDRSDPVLAAVLEQAAGSTGIREQKRLLTLALRDFDAAMICTIHGFCASVLREFAFENRRLFTMELTGDLTEVIRELVYDHFRLHFYGGDELKAALLKHHGLTPDKLTGFVGRVLDHPGAGLEPADRPEPDFDLLRLELAAFGELWKRERGAILRLLADSEELSRGKDAYNPANLAGHAAELDRLADGIFRPEGFRAVEFFSSRALARSVTPARQRRGVRPPEHRFFDRCTELAEIVGELETRFQLGFLDFVRRELGRRREELGISSYGDLLTDLAAALDEPKAAEAVRRRFGAALIDEFQDTDPIQYRIFDTLFPAAGTRPLFLVGDPKQAIYAFRGADLFTYARARTETANRWSLDTNFRSERRLVEAVNELFVRPGFSPFASSLIDFPTPLRSAGRPESENRELRIRGETDPAPLKLLYPSAALREKFGSSRSAGESFALSLTARLLSRMLADPDQTLGERRLRPADFAILVANNRQGPLMKQELAHWSIPAVLYKSDNVFASREAENLLCLLNALLHYEYLPAVRQALTLDLFRLTAPEIREEEKLFFHQDLFRRCADAWRQRGFLTAFSLLCSELAVRRTLLSAPDGERRLTNYQHLAELLHRKEQQRKLGQYSLAAFFRHATSHAAEEAELRLESDREAVSIITVHKSKGLQYRIVFCPFLFTFAAREKDDGPVCYHPDSGGRPVLALAPDEEIRKQAAAEAFSERLRLLYVALTRAENRCLVVSYPTKEPNALDHLFGSIPDPAGRAESAVRRLEVRDLPDGVPFAPAAEKTAPLQLPAVSRRIHRAWAQHSFSSLVRPDARPDEAFDETDYDESEEPASAAPETGGIFVLPGGERTGNCFHRIFEKLDFTEKDPAAIRRLAAESLTIFGFDPQPEILDPVVEMIGHTLRIELSPGLRLNRIANEDTLRELRFTFPVRRRGVPARRLQELLRRFGTAARPYALPEHFHSDLLPDSLLTGAIDLVFRQEGQYYLADWKSNRLDGSRGSFQPAGIAAEMSRNAYCLQYLLYVVALDRYLRRRQPGYSYEKHFGGVFYLFLRGLDAGDPECGVYRDLRPDPELIRSLSSLLPEELP